MPQPMFNLKTSTTAILTDDSYIHHIHRNLAWRRLPFVILLSNEDKKVLRLTILVSGGRQVPNLRFLSPQAPLDNYNLGVGVNRPGAFAEYNAPRHSQPRPAGLPVGAE